jgi:hypothetical protein
MFIPRDVRDTRSGWVVAFAHRIRAEVDWYREEDNVYRKHPSGDAIHKNHRHLNKSSFLQRFLENAFCKPKQESEIYDTNPKRIRVAKGPGHHLPPRQREARAYESAYTSPNGNWMMFRSTPGSDAPAKQPKEQFPS